MCNVQYAFKILKNYDFTLDVRYLTLIPSWFVTLELSMINKIVGILKYESDMNQ